MKWEKSCESNTADSRIVFSENRSKLTVLNESKSRFKRVVVDDCAIREGERCDYLLIRQHDRSEYFIELKGSNIRKACSQLRKSMTVLRDGSLQCVCFVISTRCPLMGTEIQLLKQEFRKKLNAILIIKNSPAEWDA